MSRYRRADIPGATYFPWSLIAVAPSFVMRLFARPCAMLSKPYNRVILLRLTLGCYCPTMWTLPLGDADYPLRWGLIKRLVSLACANEYHRADWMTASKTKHRESTFWQRRYWEHCITTEADYLRHRDHIAINPFKHGLVNRVRDLPKGHKGLILLFTRMSYAAFILRVGLAQPIP
jgi:putative transposase